MIATPIRTSAVRMNPSLTTTTKEMKVRDILTLMRPISVCKNNV